MAKNRRVRRNARPRLPLYGRGIDPILHNYMKLRDMVVDDVVPSQLPDGSTVYGLVLVRPEYTRIPEKAPRKVAWIMQDPEGNGPGFLDIVQP